MSESCAAATDVKSDDACATTVALRSSIISLMLPARGSPCQKG